MALFPGQQAPTQDASGGAAQTPWNRVLGGIAAPRPQPAPGVGPTPGGTAPTGAGPRPFGGAPTGFGSGLPFGGQPSGYGGPATAPRQPATPPQIASENPGQYPGTTPSTPAPLTPGGGTAVPTPTSGGLTGTPATSTTTATPQPTPIPTATPAATGPAGAAQPTGAETGNLPGGAGQALTAYGPDSSLIGSQINASANPSRSDIANQYFNEMATASQPAYQAALRNATQQAAATGSLGSGMLNTSYGNLALQQDQMLNNLQQQLQTQATAGTISDNQYNTGVAQQQQSYQAAQAQQALQNQIAQLQLENQIGGSQAGYLAGYNPWPGITGSNIYGNQSAQSQNQLQQLMQAAGLGSQLSGILGGGTDIGSYLGGVAPYVPTDVSTAIPGAINDFSNLLG